jgi:putative membrane protein
MWWHHEGFGWFAVFGGLLWLILLGVIIWAVISLVSGGHQPQQRREEDPLEIAKRRYARGEITREQYEQIRNDLLGRPPPS